MMPESLQTLPIAPDLCYTYKNEESQTARGSHTSCNTPHNLLYVSWKMIIPRREMYAAIKQTQQSENMQGLFHIIQLSPPVQVIRNSSPTPHVGGFLREAKGGPN